MKQYGLEPARIEVAFREKDQKEFRRLLIGEKTPTGSDLYAKTPDQSRVFLISSYLDSTFNKNAFNLRDKAILKFDRDKADIVEIDGAFPLQFTRQGMEWRIAKPIAARADYAAVEGIVTRLSSAQMQEIVAPEATDLRQYGLDSPATRVDVGTGSARATLLVGKPNAEGLPFAKDASRPAVFTIEKALITDLSKPVGDFRRKDVFDFRSFTANRIELRREAGHADVREDEGRGRQGSLARRCRQERRTAPRIEELLTSAHQPARAVVRGRRARVAQDARADRGRPVRRQEEDGDRHVRPSRRRRVCRARRRAGRREARSRNTFDEAIKALDALK